MHSLPSSTSSKEKEHLPYETNFNVSFCLDLLLIETFDMDKDFVLTCDTMGLL